MRNKPSNSIPIDSERWLTVPLAASSKKVHPNYIRSLIHGGELKAVHFGKGFLIEKTDLDNLLLRRKKFFPPYRRGTKPWIAAMHAENRGGAQ